MFVVSVTKDKLKKSAVVALAVAVLSLGFVGALHFLNNSDSMPEGEKESLSVSDEGDILTFISNYGWQVDDEPVEIRDVVIPETFDEVYNSYNNIQIEQGFDLKKYAGQRVKRWTYIIRNYPETSPEDDFIRINILVSDGVVIGGDVCSVKLDGFMHGFSMA